MNLIGSKIIARVKNAARDDKGKLIPGKIIEVGGIIDYLGPNNYLGWPLQITIDRCPYEMDKVTDMRIVE